MALPRTQLGSTGTSVTRICLGTMGFGSSAWRPWVLDEADALPILEHAFDLGIDFLDTADMYSRGESERVVGKALAGRRDDVVLATKLYHPMSDRPNDRGLSRRHIRRAIEGSLERLGTDHVDLYQVHRYDATTPIDETLAALSGLVDEGRVHYLGASTMWAWQFARMLERQQARGWHRFATMQPHYSLAYREEEREMLPLCRAEGVGVLPWSPLARGYLAKDPDASTTRQDTDAGRSFFGTEADQEVHRRVGELAQDKGVSRAQVALAWLLHQDAVVAPIVGVTKRAHVDDAVEALELRLSDKELEHLAQPYEPKRVSAWVRGGGVPREHLHPSEPDA